jgi:hypothetical protein
MAVGQYWRILKWAEPIAHSENYQGYLVSPKPADRSVTDRKPLAAIATS